MNSVNLVGRLTKDPNITYSTSGSSIAAFTLAVDRKFKSKDEQTADFINCKAFGKTAEFVEKYFQKGMRMGLCGRIQTGNYTNKDGAKVYYTEVIADNVEFVESKKAEAPAKDNDGFMNIPDGIDEELPFN